MISIIVAIAENRAIGSENKLNAMVDNNRISLRYSGLEVRLRRLMELDREL